MASSVVAMALHCCWMHDPPPSSLTHTQHQECNQTTRRISKLSLREGCKLVITPWQEDNAYAPLANPETSRGVAAGRMEVRALSRRWSLPLSPCLFPTTPGARARSLSAGVGGLPPGCYPSSMTNKAQRCGVGRPLQLHRARHPLTEPNLPGWRGVERRDWPAFESAYA